RADGDLLPRGPSVDAAKRSPHLEAFASKGYEVLFFTDNIDEIWLEREPTFEGRSILSVGHGEVDLEAGDEAARLRLTYFEIMRGPWDRQDHFSPFAIDIPHPPGAGFYPEDLSGDEFKAYAEAHPEQKQALEGLFTLVQRDAQDPAKLVTVPYSQAYKEWLEPPRSRSKRPPR
ncbi:MAG: hypothetical protein HC927_01380, partial [Deltaproteobacteria bacterium]|nr:hypothetical protein [Deltaproteobacteria bacterium]